MSTSSSLVSAATPIAPYRLVGAAAGGLFTTAADLARLLTAYSPSNSAVAGRGVLSPTMLALLRTPVAAASLPGVKSESVFGGLGHFVHTCADRTTILYHSGGNPGVRAYMLLHLPSGDGLALITNSDNAVPLIGQLVDRWGAAHAHDLPPLF
jgi:CubicO group peptidase (beta-lactamase class C family)